MDKQESFRTIRGYELMGRGDRELTPAMEDYLEMLYRMCMEDGYARIGRLSELLQVRPSSASKMAAKLRESGHVALDHNGSLTLTGKGEQVAKYLLYRHDTVAAFLSFLGHRDTLEETELLEHVITPKTVTQLHKLMAVMDQNPDFLAVWQKNR